MRRIATLTALAAVAVGAMAAAPAVESGDAGESVIVCVRFADVTVPLTPIRVERPTDQICVYTPNVRVPLGNR